MGNTCFFYFFFLLNVFSSYFQQEWLEHSFFHLFFLYEHKIKKNHSKSWFFDIYRFIITIVTDPQAELSLPSKASTKDHSVLFILNRIMNDQKYELPSGRISSSDLLLRCYPRSDFSLLIRTVPEKIFYIIIFTTTLYWTAKLLVV